MTNSQTIIQAIRREFQDARNADSAEDRAESIAEIRQLMAENGDLLGRKQLAQIEHHLARLDGGGTGMELNEKRDIMQAFKRAVRNADTAQGAERSAAIAEVEKMRDQYADMLGPKQIGRIEAVLARLRGESELDDDEVTEREAMGAIRTALQELQRARHDEESQSAALARVQALRDEHRDILGRKQLARIDAFIGRATGEDDFDERHERGANKGNNGLRHIKQAFRQAKRAGSESEKAAAIDQIHQWVAENREQLTEGQLKRLQRQLDSLG